MARYRLLFKKSVAKDLRTIPKQDVQRILKRIEALAEEPRGIECEKLSDQQRYRVRQGWYRIIYEVQHNNLIFIVVKVDHRNDVYQR